MTPDTVIKFLGDLGPTGLLAGAVWVLWRKYEGALAEASAEKAARLTDARETTTRMLELAERVHEIVDTLDDVRRSRHD